MKKSGIIELKENSHLHSESSLTQYADSLDIDPIKSNEKNVVLKKLGQVLLLAAIFMIIEVIGGILADSIAILSDAAHMLSDLLGFAISMISVWISSFPSNERYSFGFQRASVIGALASTTLIWILSGFLIYHSIFRMFHLDQVELNGKVMLLTAIFGLITNIIMVKILHANEDIPHTHSHSHSHAHNSQFIADKKQCCDSPESRTYGKKDKLTFGKSNENKYYLYKDEEPHLNNSLVYSPDRSVQIKGDNLFQEKGVSGEPQIYDLASKNAENNIQEEKEFKFDKDLEGLEDSNHKNHHSPENSHQTHDHTHNHSHHNKHPHEHGHGHGHGHEGCSHHHFDLNLSAASIHILGDILQSIGVIIGSIIIQFSPETFKILDPILTLIFSVIVLFTTKRILNDCFNIIMQSTPEMYYLSDLTELFEKIPNVIRVHNMHMWSLMVGKPILSAHVIVEGNASIVLAQITEICRKYKIYHSTIQIENQDDELNKLIDCNHNIC